MWDDFKKFIMQGDVIDLAVAIVVGTAFKAVVDSFTNDVLMAIVAAIFGKPDFSSVTIDIGKGVIRIGSFINAVISFLIVAAAMFVVVRTYEALQARRAKGEEPAPPPTEEIQLLTEIRDSLSNRG